MYHTISEPVMKWAYLLAPSQAKCHDIRLVTSEKSQQHQTMVLSVTLNGLLYGGPLRHHILKANCNEISDHVKSLV